MMRSMEREGKKRRRGGAGHTVKYSLSMHIAYNSGYNRTASGGISMSLIPLKIIGTEVNAKL
jgi:hypothetical protein